jgi:hypothetical protein
MRIAGTIRSLLAACRRGLVLLAALSFVLSGMASVHTAHAIAGGHDMPAATTSGEVSSHCDSHEQQAPEAKQDKTFSCCAFACTPFMVLSSPPAFVVAAAHGDVIPLPPAQAVLDRQLAGLFRPPRSHA